MNYTQKEKAEGMRINLEALQEAQGCYMALERFRKERERNKRYNYGDQWGDVIEVDGRYVKEETYIREQGSQPLKNNLIRRLVRNVIGVFSSQYPKGRCYSSNPQFSGSAKHLNRMLGRTADTNRLESLYMRTLEEFLIGGLVVHKKWYGPRHGMIDCWTDYVHPRSFFVDENMSDFRLWDCKCIGQLHDIDFPSLCAQFAHSPEECEDLRRIYDAKDTTKSYAWEEFGYGNGTIASFSAPVNPSMCRVIEVWRRELSPIYRWHDRKSGRYVKASESELQKAGRRAKPADAQWSMEEKWRYYFLTPAGHVLAEGDSPYSHGTHPYVAKAYPLIDGEIHAFVGDVIDQQRYTNRLITMHDWTIRSSAKGLLLVPEDCVPRGMNPRDFADAWSRFNGVLLYHPSQRGDSPRQISGTPSHPGITDLLNLQMRLFEEISGVNGALEGKLANSAMSAELFNKQTQNATMALQDLLKTFKEFIYDCTAKDLSLLQQYSPGLSPEARQYKFTITF